MPFEVAICAKNAENYISDAIQSAMETALTFVVDDHSSDNTVSIAKSLGCRVITNQGSGLGAARNTALEATDSAQLMFLDSDDILIPGLTRDLFRNYRDGEYAGFLRGLRVEFMNRDTSWPIAHRHIPEGQALPTLVGGTLLDVGLARSIPFSEGLDACDILFMKSAQDSMIPIREFHQVTMLRRNHGANMTANWNARSRLYLDLIGEMRKRANNA